MLTSLTSMPTTVGELNIPGINSFEFVPIDAIDTWPDYINAFNTITTPVVLKAGFEWLIGTAIENTLDYKEVDNRNEHGVVYTGKLSGSVRKENPAMSALLTQMEKSLYVVRYTDKNGHVKLIGSPTDPCLFKHTFSTSKGIIDYEFTLVKQQKAPFYTG